VVVRLKKNTIKNEIKKKMKSYKNFKKQIKIPVNVKIKKQTNILFFYGPLGLNMIDLKKLDPKGLGAIVFNNKKHSFLICSYSKSFLGCIYSLIKNKIQGVTGGFLIYLKIVGIGYRAQLENHTLVFKLGFSHDLRYELPCSVRVFLIEPTLLCFYGIDKNQITQTVAKIRLLKPPSAYKGKGLRLDQELVNLKVAKKK
jgi:large subunit ribosomal protein L6